MKQDHTIPFARPWITENERDAVQDVLQGHVLTHGNKCKEFEDGFASYIGDSGYCLTTSSCMSALFLAYLQMGIGPGDEVIVPAQTHTATAHAVELVGAKPIFVDCDLHTGNMLGNKVEKLITKNTKAIGLVHFLGIPCDMDHIVKIAREHQLKIVEDCALAIGAMYKGEHVGLIGDIGCFSFYPAKHITTGEGGMFVTKDPCIANQVSKLRAFGVDRSYNERETPGLYDVQSLGMNSRMSEIHAAIGCQQLDKIDRILQSRSSNFTKLKENLCEIKGLSIIDANDPNTTSSHYCLSILLQDKFKNYRPNIIKSLNNAGIGTSIYYPHPLPRLAYYEKKYGYQAELFANAQTISDYSIALPVGPHVKSGDIEYMSTTLKNIIFDLA